MDLIQPVSRLSWPVLVDLLSDSEGFFQISCQSLTYPFPFFRKVKENQKKDPFCTKTRLTRYLRNLIPQNCTNKSQKWLHEIIQFLKIFKILAVSLCQRWQKRTRFKAIWQVFSNPHFSDPRPPSGRPRERTQYLSGGSAAKKGSVFSVFHFWEMSKFELASPNLSSSAIRLSGYPDSLGKLSGTIQKLSGTIQKLSGTIQSYPELSKAIRSYPKSMDSYGKLSGAIQNLKKLSGAIQSYPELSKAIRNYPKSTDSYGAISILGIFSSPGLCPG